MARRASKSTGLGVGCRVMLGLAAGILLLVVISPFALRTWRVWGLPDNGEPFDVQSYRGRTVPDENNAALDYEAAQNLFVAPSTIERPSETEPRHWREVDIETRDWLSANQSALDLWLAGTFKPTSRFFEADANPLDFAPSHLHGLFNFIKLARLKSLELQDADDYASAWKWLAAALRCTRQLGQNDHHLVRIFGVTLFTRATDATIHWSAGASPELTAQALAEIQEIYSHTVTASETIRWEYINMMKTVDLAPTLWILNEPRASKLPITATFANLLEFSDLPRQKRPSRRMDTMTKLYGVPGHLDAGTADAIERGARWGLTSQMMLSRVDLTLPYDQELARYSMLVTTLRLRLWHLEHGEFPERLEQLSPPALPEDPFASPAAPLRYRKEGEGFVIWSVGPNGVDDGATFDLNIEKGDFGWKVER